MYPCRNSRIPRLFQALQRTAAAASGDPSPLSLETSTGTCNPCAAASQVPLPRATCRPALASAAQHSAALSGGAQALHHTSSLSSLADLHSQVPHPAATACGRHLDLVLHRRRSVASCRLSPAVSSRLLSRHCPSFLLRHPRFCGSCFLFPILSSPPSALLVATPPTPLEQFPRYPSTNPLLRRQSLAVLQLFPTVARPLLLTTSSSRFYTLRRLAIPSLPTGPGPASVVADSSCSPRISISFVGPRAARSQLFAYPAASSRCLGSVTLLCRCPPALHNPPLAAPPPSGA